VVDDVLGAAQLVDPLLQVVPVLAHQLAPLVAARRGHRLAHLVETEAHVLAGHDQRHPGHVRVAVAPPPVGQPARRQQTGRLPVPQHVGRQPEPVGQLPDADRG
jgi:hypothetical protein